jgi:hypothetical protein
MLFVRLYISTPFVAGLVQTPQTIALSQGQQLIALKARVRGTSLLANCAEARYTSSAATSHCRTSMVSHVETWRLYLEIGSAVSRFVRADGDIGRKTPRPCSY